MDVQSVIRWQLEWAHDTVEQAVADLSPDQLHYQIPNAMIQPIAAVYAHVVLAEDWLINDKMRQQPTQYERDGWVEKAKALPFSASMERADDWAASVRTCDFDTLREFAQQVYAATDAYVASLTDIDLARPIPFGPLGDLPAAKFLSNIVAHHVGQHGGELCALKGVLGMRGLPY